MEQNYFAEMKDNVDSLIEKGIFLGKNIFVFGYNEAAESIVDYLASKDINVCGILDNNKTKVGLEYKTAKVVLPNFLEKYDVNDVVVVIANRVYNQMVRQLKELGYDKNIYRLVDFNTYSEYSLEADVFNGKIERVKRGRAILDKVREKYEKELLVVCPYKALGDVYNTLLFLPEYLKSINKDSFVLVCLEENVDVANLFGVKNSFIFSQKEIDDLTQAIIFENYENAIIAHHNVMYTDCNLKIINSKSINFTELYKYGIFGLNSSATPHYPKNSLKSDFDPNIIEKGNTVILSPYAKSVISIPTKFWEDMVIKLKSSGKKVFTNVLGEEKPINGTIPISGSLNDILSITNYAGYFVGIRSGLCDVLSTSSAKKTIIYPNVKYSTTNIDTKDFFHLDGVEELIYTENNK